MAHPMSFLTLSELHISAKVVKFDAALLMATGGMAEAVVLKDDVFNCCPTYQ